ncbi:hypothetical protein SA2016_0955 [Sinomonas atrocyanea]|uniref:Glycosyl hydrolase family 88 n=1 Tax=Sinomonas atrocyanea TaxID=37927 RepID=A0A126ZWU2_9MICC|nr:glycoside hydrolase family 88 protein [Sinomonas atrocyanea]AMM31640.1 hypothetical protein SA2016_0955 [Sinomonas atrocyanea]GEB64208.1 hypothetical protein SAT01_16560 [Sinomonas atrocyanea]GGG57221.1 hypothetical protein GCM10007172_05150 [Sinomonas atrocyanea]
MGPSAAELLGRLARRTRAYDFTVWFWGDAIAIDGLLEAAELVGDKEASAHAERFLRRPAAPLGWRDHLAPGDALLRLAAVTDDPAPLEQARRLADHLLGVPRAEDAPLYRPDDPRYRHTVWVDSIYHVPPFLARLAGMTGEGRWYDAALAEQAAHLRVLTPAGSPFPAHAYDTGARSIHGPGWGRGVGWALLGMVDTLSVIPADHPGHDEAQAELRALAEEVLALQDSTGCWRTVIDDREAYLESSTAAMFCAAFTKGVRTGVLDGRFAAAAEDAWRYTEARIDQDGSFWGVSACTWASTAGAEDAAMYRTLPTEVNVWGQGAAMRAAAERLRTLEALGPLDAKAGNSTADAPSLQTSH